MAGKKDKCDKCIWRNDNKLGYKCDYASKTGVTRRAQPPEQCTYFDSGEKKVSPLKSAERLYPGRVGSRYDWEKGRNLYLEGKTDPEIAKELGCSDGAVFDWRKKNGLPPNAGRGWTSGRTRRKQNDPA